MTLGKKKTQGVDLFRPALRHVPLGRLEERAQCGARYGRKVRFTALGLAMMGAFARLLPALRAVLALYPALLATRHGSTLWRALDSKGFALFCELLEDAVCGPLPTGADQAVILDSTSSCIPLRGAPKGSPRINRRTAGGMLLCAFSPQLAAHGRAGLRLLGAFPGMGRDSNWLVPLLGQLARGPRYILDRGFYSRACIVALLAAGHRFLMRVNAGAGQLVFETERVLFERRPAAGPRTGAGQALLVRDLIVRLGSTRGGRRDEGRPRVRLLEALLPTGERLVVVCEPGCSRPARELLALYRRRQQVEKLFRLVKRQLGLAHLYCRTFGAMVSQARLCFVALVLLLKTHGGRGALDGGDAHKALGEALSSTRLSLGLWHSPWRPNTAGQSRIKAARQRKQRTGPATRAAP